MRRICVFCGSSPGNDPIFAESARLMARAIVERGMELVYGGAHCGLMGVLADEVLAGGGRVVGVIPDALVALEVAHTGLTELHVVGSMHERKQMMADMADGFIALPGGFGTFEELCEILTWAQLGIHTKPCGLLNVAGYYDPLLQLFDRATGAGFLPEIHRRIVLDAVNPGELIDRMSTAHVPDLGQAIGRDET